MPPPKKEARSKRNLKQLNKLQLRLLLQLHQHPQMATMLKPPKKLKLRPRRKQLPQAKLPRSRRNKSVCDYVRRKRRKRTNSLRIPTTQAPTSLEICLLTDQNVTHK